MFYGINQCGLDMILIYFIGGFSFSFCIKSFQQEWAFKKEYIFNELNLISILYESSQWRRD